MNNRKKRNLNNNEIQHHAHQSIETEMELSLGTVISPNIQAQSTQSTEPGAEPTSQELVNSQTIEPSPIIGTSKYLQQWKEFQLRALNDQTNYAMQSRNKGRIIIIKPEDNIRTIMSSPGKFSSSFSESSFGNADVKDIRPNYRKGLIIVEFKEISREQLYGFTNIPSKNR